MLKVGTEIYNGGDRANDPHFGTIVEISDTQYGPTQYKIKVNDENKAYWVSINSFSEKYEGHGGTRFVTKEEYLKWKEKVLQFVYKKTIKSI
jgi:hypothetical protein